MDNSEQIELLKQEHKVLRKRNKKLGNLIQLEEGNADPDRANKLLMELGLPWLNLAQLKHLHQTCHAQKDEVLHKWKLLEKGPKQE